MVRGPADAEMLRSGDAGTRRPAVSLLRVHRLTKAQARRIAVRAQLLDAPRPTDLLLSCTT